jgi:hypothetical protein
MVETHCTLVTIRTPEAVPSIQTATVSETDISRVFILNEQEVQFQYATATEAKCSSLFCDG